MDNAKVIEKYRTVKQYFKSIGDKKALERAENKPFEYYAQTRLYAILEELASK
jgi:hypothetical protein